MRHPDAILADTRAFMKSRVILTAAELDLFTRIDEKPSTAVELAEALGLDPRATRRLLDAIVTFGFLEAQDGRYRLAGDGVFFSSHHPETVLPMVLHLNDLWNGWSRLTEIVRSGPGPRLEVGPEMDQKDRRAFIGAMHVIGRSLSIEIAEAYDLSRFKRLLDIGGASGSYTIAFLNKNPELTAVIFDLKHVIPLSRERIRDEELADRVEFVSGDFYKDELPKGCDLALLSAIIHQNSTAQNVELYRKIYQALDPGGTVLIRDHVMDESRTAPPAGAMFALNMLVNTPGGDTFTFREIKDSLEEAGFEDVKWVRQGKQMDSLVEARKPA